MRTFCWNIIRRFFNKEIQSLMNNHADNVKVSYHNEMQKNEKIRRTIINYPIGTKIISQSNEPDDLLIANVIRHEILHHGIMLMVQNEEGKVFTLLDKTPALWAQEREDALRKLSWAERYNVMSKYHYFINKETEGYKESSEYQNRLK